MGVEWNQDPNVPEKKLSLRRLKKIICKAEGYERDMLALLYGSTGIMSLDEKTQFLTKGGKIELKDISETSPSVITGLVPAEEDEINKHEDLHSFKNSDLLSSGGNFDDL